MSNQQIPGSLAESAGMPWWEGGKKFVRLYVPSACTALTPYAWYTVDTSQRPIQSAMPASGAICRVAVACETKTAAGYAKFQLAGICDGLITPSITGVTSQTLKIASALVAAGGAATVTADDFAIVETGATDTEFDVYLLDREVNKHETHSADGHKGYLPNQDEDIIGGHEIRRDDGK